MPRRNGRFPSHPLNRPQKPLDLSHDRDQHLELGGVGSREGLASSLGTLAHHLGRLVATDTSTPLATVLLVLVGAEEDMSGTKVTMKNTRQRTS